MKDSMRVRRMPMEENLHARVDPDGALCARHDFAFCGVRYLTLGYDISRPGA